MLKRVVLTFESVYEILKYIHSNHFKLFRNSFMLCCLLACTRLFFCLLRLRMKSSKRRAIEQNFPLLVFIVHYKAVLTLAFDYSRLFKRKLLRSNFL